MNNSTIFFSKFITGNDNGIKTLLGAAAMGAIITSIAINSHKTEKVVMYDNTSKNVELIEKISEAKSNYNQALLNGIGFESQQKLVQKIDSLNNELNKFQSK